MKYDCDMIADLLPLYKDGVCSEASNKIVYEHLSECAKCKNIYDKMSDSYIDEEFVREKEEVINSQAKFFKRKSAIAGSIVAAVFAIPILVCLIVDLAVGSGLGWFFIVLAAMFIPTSLIVVPLMMPKNKLLYTIGSFVFSILLLFGVICIYTKGSWFFVAASATLFGLSFLFAPLIVCRNPVKGYLKNFKGLTLMGIFTLLFVIMMVCIGVKAGSPGYYATAFGISLPIIGFIWLMFLLIRYVPINGFLKTSIFISILTVFDYFSVDMIDGFIGTMNSDDAVVVSSSRSPIELVIGLTIAAIFAVVGFIIMIVKKNKGGKNNEKNQ